MARLFTLAAGVIFAAVSSVIVARLASVSIPLAYLSLAVVGVAAIGAIVLLARQTLRNPWTALDKANQTQDPAKAGEPDRATRRVAP